MKVEVKISDRLKEGAIATVRLEFAEGGISLNHIFVRDVNGKPRLTFPLDKNKSPMVYLRGELKQQVTDAVWSAFCSKASETCGKLEE